MMLYIYMVQPSLLNSVLMQNIMMSLNNDNQTTFINSLFATMPKMTLPPNGSLSLQQFLSLLVAAQGYRNMPFNNNIL